MASLEEFEILVKYHDLTYNFSDDNRAWRRGCDSYDQIIEMGEKLPDKEIIKIWNKWVDKKLRLNRSQFYWKEKE